MKDDYIRIRLSVDEKAELKRQAEMNHMSMSQYIVQLIYSHAEKQKPCERNNGQK